MTEPQNKGLQQTIRSSVACGPASRATVIYSRLAAEAQRSADCGVEGVLQHLLVPRANLWTRRPGMAQASTSAQPRSAHTLNKPQDFRQPDHPRGSGCASSLARPLPGRRVPAPPRTQDCGVGAGCFHPGRSRVRANHRRPRGRHFRPDSAAGSASGLAFTCSKESAARYRNSRSRKRPVMARQNKALEQTKHGSGARTLPFAGSRAIIIKSCFAAQRQRSTDLKR